MNLKRKQVSALRLGLIGFLTLAGVLYVASRKLETHAENQVAPHVRVSAISDWSHHDLVYSRPATPEQERKLQLEPRYQLQLRKARRDTTVKAQ